MNLKTDLLIIGAGPFGLSIAAYAKYLDIDFRIVGKSMEFWKNNMPEGMYLRSGVDWHIDPCEIHTFIDFLNSREINQHTTNNPLPLKLYLDYTEWFRLSKGIEPMDSYVTKLDYKEGKLYPFIALLEDGTVIKSKGIVIATGFRYFRYLPEELSSLIPEEKYSHTCELVDFKRFESKDCVILGGRQSAFEWASLIRKEGANRIYIIHRHKTPEFTESDWSWVNPLINKMIEDPDYYLKLSQSDKKAINDRFWQEGRLKLEPWLTGTLYDDRIVIYPESNISSVAMDKNNRIRVQLDNHKELTADYFIFATGYKVDINRLPFLASGDVLRKIHTHNGYPKLGSGLQCSLPGLYFTSLPATQDYGAFFGFTVSCVASAKIICNSVKEYLDAR